MDEPMTKAHDPRYMHALLAELHAELERSGSLSDEERQLLVHVKDDVDSFLKRADSQAAGHDESLGERLQEGISAFEVSHPDLTAAMQRVLDSLSQTGI